MGSTRGQKDVRLYQVLGAPIAAGAKTEDAVTAAGVSSPVWFRWFRHAGGVNPSLPTVVSGRYLLFPEREEIALLKAKGLGVRRDRT
jgi:hypothetical protein